MRVGERHAGDGHPPVSEGGLHIWPVRIDLGSQGGHGAGVAAAENLSASRIGLHRWLTTVGGGSRGALDTAGGALILALHHLVSRSP